MPRHIEEHNMTEKKPVQLQRFEDLSFSPRFEHGDMARLAELCGGSHGTALGAGWARLTRARIPWTIRYDEVLTVFEGELRLHADGTVHVLGPRDAIWLPAGTELVYEADEALVHFAIHPADWQDGDA